MTNQATVAEFKAALILLHETAKSKNERNEFWSAVHSLANEHGLLLTKSDEPSRLENNYIERWRRLDELLGAHKYNTHMPRWDGVLF